jgi:arginyl-tRNA synthetase
MVISHLRSVFSTALSTLGATENLSPQFTHPDRPENGDYTTTIAFALAKELKQSPLSLATSLAEKISPDDIIEKVVVAAPGFINIFITEQYMRTQLNKIAQGTFQFHPYHLGEHTRLMIEFAHPNTLKLFHIGHLRNIITGESLVRLFEASHNQVIRANYQGDVGMHIAKTLWRLKQMDESGELGPIRTAPLREKITAIGKAYAAGNAAFESDTSSKQQIVEMNKAIYAKDPAIMPLYTETRQWSLDYFEEIYRRVYTTFDSYYFESQMSDRGVELCRQAVEKGILIEDDGAVIIPGEKYGVDRRVFINSLGLPTYEGKEMALAEREFNEHGEIDACIHLVTAEQSSYFKAAFKAQELLGIVPPGAQRHQTYGWVDIKGQKMSSRKGNVVEGEFLLNEAKKRILETYEKSTDASAETLAVAAVKYAFLKHGLQTKIEFDMGEAVNLNGNSGPYLLYTYVRTQSVLRKEHSPDTDQLSVTEVQLNTEERNLMRQLAQFINVVYDATRNHAPNLLTTFLYELAQQYNYFYQKHPILKAEPAVKQFRLLLTKAVSQTLRRGLSLLGISTVEEM